MPLRDTSFRDYWTKRKAQQEKARNSGWILLIFSGRRRFQVICPQNDVFVAGARAIGGTFRPKTKLWSFGATKVDPVLALCNRVYGYEHVRVVGPDHKHKCPHHLDKPCGPVPGSVFRQCACEGCAKCPKRIG